MSERRALVDVSLELAHVYPAEIKRTAGGWSEGEYAAAERAIEAVVAREAPWARSLCDWLTGVGRSVHVSVMLDDYSAPVDPSCVIDVARLITSQLAAAGVPVNHVALESECTGGAERLLQQLLPSPPPRVAVGTSDTPLGMAPGLAGPWLANEDPSPVSASVAVEDFRADPFADPEDADATSEALSPSRNPDSQEGDPSPGGHGIHLDVELWSQTDGERRWACPTLAACWQLARLGALRDLGDRPLRIGLPVDALDELRPDGDRESPMPPARETLTILEPRMHKVEHAVRTVLSRVLIPGDWCSHLRSPQEHLDRIGYLFPTATVLPVP